MLIGWSPLVDKGEARKAEKREEERVFVPRKRFEKTSLSGNSSAHFPLIVYEHGKTNADIFHSPKLFDFLFTIRRSLVTLRSRAMAIDSTLTEKFLGLICLFYGKVYYIE